MSDISYNEKTVSTEAGSSPVFVPIEISAPMVDISLLEGKYSASFIDMIAQVLTPEIERLVSVEGLAASGVRLHLVFAPDTYMEHTSEAVTYRRLLISYGQGAPRDLWIKWTRLDGSCEGYSLSDTPSADSVLIEISEDVPQKIREKEYRFLARTSPEKYRAAIGKRNVTEWRELIKRAIKNGDLTRVEKTVEISEETAALTDKLAAVLGISEPEASAPEINEPETSSEDDIAALARAALGLDNEELSVVSFDEEEEAFTEEPFMAEPEGAEDIFEDISCEDTEEEDFLEETEDELFDEAASEDELEEYTVEETEKADEAIEDRELYEDEPLYISPAEEPEEASEAEEIYEIDEVSATEEVPEAEDECANEEEAPAKASDSEAVTKDELEERIRAELEAKIRLEYESRARKQAEEEAERLRLENERLREAARLENEKRRSERAAEEERIRQELEVKLREESRERERLAEAAREALYERERLEAERAREAERLAAEERAEKERIEREREAERIERERALEAERIRASMEERASAPAEKKYNYTKKTVLLLFRRSVDPNVTARIHEIIKATVDYYGKSDVYIRIKASLPDSTTVRLDFVEIPVEEMELLTNIIKVLGNSGLGIAKAKIQ